jgi:putative glutamine amidotransferase
VPSRDRIGITQRVEVSPRTVEARDCLDQRWAPLLEAIGVVPVPLANRVADPAAYLEALDLRGIVLSGGNDLACAPGARSAAPERDLFERAALAWALDSGRPVLGVCRGMQAINVFLGGRIEPVPGHAATRHRVLACGANPFGWPESFEVNSYHDFGIPRGGIAPSFEAVATSDDGFIEAFRHVSARCAGIMWHPERESPFVKRDIEILRRVLVAE